MQIIVLVVIIYNYYFLIQENASVNLIKFMYHLFAKTVIILVILVKEYFLKIA